MYLDSPFGQDIIITQSNHGDAQNDMAFDFGHSTFYAPALSKMLRIYNYGPSNHANYFDAGLQENGWFVQVVHANASAIPGQTVRIGQTIGVAVGAPIHFHVAVCSNRYGWQPLLNHIRRDKGYNLWFGKKGVKKSPWTDWETYPLMELDPVNINPIKEMVRLPWPVRCYSNVDGLRIRSEASTSSEKLGTLNKGEFFDSEWITEGEVVKETKEWYKCHDGYVSRAYLDIPLPTAIVDPNPQLVEEIKKLNDKTSTAIKILS